VFAIPLVARLIDEHEHRASKATPPIDQAATAKPEPKRLEIAASILTAETKKWIHFSAPEFRGAMSAPEIEEIWYDRVLVDDGAHDKECYAYTSGSVIAIEHYDVSNASRRHFSCEFHYVTVDGRVFLQKHSCFIDK
jgi:hypothetical protein